jgi:hypothetical protein
MAFASADGALRCQWKPRWRLARIATKRQRPEHHRRITVAEIAKTADALTPSLKQFICGPMYSAHSHGIAYAWFHDTNWWAGRKLAKLELAERRRIEPGYFASIPTPLGLAVRQYLLEKGDSRG